MKQTIDFLSNALGNSITRLGFKTGILNVYLEFENIFPATEGRVIKIADKPTRHYCIRLVAKALFWNLKIAVTFLV